MDFYIDEKDKELGRARLSQVGEGASAGGRSAGRREARNMEYQESFHEKGPTSGPGADEPWL